MKTKHTPGPWATDIDVAIEIIDREGVGSVGGATIYQNHGSGKGNEICYLRHDPDDGLDLHNAEHQANAKLISAAPDLLEALQAIMEVANPPYGTELHTALKLAQSAITKATP